MSDSEGNITLRALEIEELIEDGFNRMQTKGAMEVVARLIAELEAKVNDDK